MSPRKKRVTVQFLPEDILKIRTKGKRLEQRLGVKMSDAKTVMLAIERLEV